MDLFSKGINVKQNTEILGENLNTFFRDNHYATQYIYTHTHTHTHTHIYIYIYIYIYVLRQELPLYKLIDDDK